MSLRLNTQTEVEIDYTNYKGERRVRRVRPIAIEYVENMYHDGAYCIRAVDLERFAEDGTPLYVERSFALKDIHSWKEVK